MARLLVQLKLRLLGNALRSSTAAKAGFFVSTFFAVLLAAGTFAGLAALRGQAGSVYVTTVVFTMFAFGWLILPIFIFGLDSTLDPATLALYPLRTRPLAVGLLAASATGAWPLANLIGLLGVTVGLARGALGVLIALVAVVLQVLFCITLARFVATSLARLLRSRRGKDLAAFLIIPIFALYELFTLGGAEPDHRGQAGPGELRRCRRMDALDTAGPGRARDPGRVERPPHRCVAAPGAAWRGHRRARRAVDKVPQPRSGDGRHHHAVLGGARFGAAVRTVRPTALRPAWHGGRPVLDLPAPRAPVAHLLGHDRGHHGRRVLQHDPDTAVSGRLVAQRRLRGRGHRRVPCRLDRDDRARLLPRGDGAHRPPCAARLLLRPEPRCRRDRGAAANCHLLRARGRCRSIPWTDSWAWRWVSRGLARAWA